MCVLSVKCILVGIHYILVDILHYDCICLLLVFLVWVVFIVLVVLKPIPVSVFLIIL
jgi:hypothetical protein